jgi:hypothetical protein
MRPKRLIKRESELTEEEREARKQASEAKWEELRQKRIQDRLAKLKTHVEEYETLKILVEKYPDLNVNSDRWGTVRYGSKFVNTIADKIEFRRSCGCCPDAEILALPYVESDLGRIYSVPERFKLGEGSAWGDFVYPSARWQEECREAGISEFLIDQMQEYLTAQILAAQGTEET